MDETLFTSIDNYCERTGPEFWSEPLNAVTNLSFVIAGIVGIVLCRRYGADRFALFLSWWAIVIGVCSGLFHTFANGVTLYADVLPIIGFILLLNWYVLTRFLGTSAVMALCILAAFYVVTGALVAFTPDGLREATNGTIGYLPALLGLLFFGGWLSRRDHPAAAYMFWAAGVFVVSAFFRSIDMALCTSLPIGTHFLWHTLNGVLLGVLLAGAARYGGKRPTVQS
ncbi:MAG: ceramidase domain-containing protein [Rhizobiaceae bacterium]|nr:ceramidase domain-containing protein [Rhizobiaceae bacterium]